MKKVILSLLICFAASTQIFAQTDTTRTRYYYYPSVDVYYNDVTGDYWYYDQPTTHWMTVKKLPATVVVDANTPKYEVWYKGPDVWKENKMHKGKYKSKNGEVKVKPEKG